MGLLSHGLPWQDAGMVQSAVSLRKNTISVLLWRNSSSFHTSSNNKIQGIRAIPSTETGWLENGLTGALRRRTWGLLVVDEKLNTTKQCTLTAQEASRTLACIKSSVASMAWEVILPLCSTLVRAHLESCVVLWSPQHRRDMDLLEMGQRRPQKWSKG